MVKYLLNSLLLFLVLTSFSFAKDDSAALQKEFGRDLSHAPFFLRFSFSKEFNKDWGKSTYSERKVFLADYEKNLSLEQAKQKAEARAEADDDKERLREKKEAERKEKDRLKARAEEEKAEEQADEDRQKEFNAGVISQEKEIQQMQQSASQGH